ncbi:ATP-binding protein [Natrialbaceae archaeon AArc-T1-2]|uniref:ATP-binding protein n=1 Tax=Natrialbaceae archaeon AArc-T1-2 TaxID=3053904 RepID=UPI00255B03C0|nr:ATP-binding protein [Natrialbaceae archaeon AArc-T1-2]WIV68914.1 ATP-binding protein [Natrialbaceae archaeon AArc-T1-2]
MSNDEYLKVTPTSGSLRRSDIPATLESLHKLSNPAAESFWSRLSPRVDTAPPTFEFLAASAGPDEPVEFYYGVNQEEHLNTLEKRLQSIYPTTFTVARTELDLEPMLGLQTEVSNEDTSEQAEQEISDGERSADLAESNLEEIDENDGGDERIEYTPFGVEWLGKAGRKTDWMTTITPFVIDEPDEEYESECPPLSAVVEVLHEMTVPTVYQILWQRKPDWRDDAEIRQSNLKEGRDTWSEEFIGSWFEPVDADPADRELSRETEDRIQRIDSKHPRRTFTVNARAVAMARPDETDIRAELDQLKASLDPLDGPFYELSGRRVREKGFLDRQKAKRAQRHLKRVLTAEIVTGGRKKRLDLVFNADELANLVVVPSGDDLTVEGSRGARSEQRSRNPLPRPNPDLMAQFREGMAIGYALDENSTIQPDPIRIPPNLLTRHYGRFASTGAGKSKAIINDALSLRETTGGPVIIVDPKGDGMCANYLRCHYERFSGLDNTYQFCVPETLPAFSFFDIRSTLEAGWRREDAIQDKVDHFHDIMRMVMGRKQYEQAFVANEILSYLIKALFDEEYGSDAFGLDDLFAAALQMQRERTVPPVAAENQNVEESLTRHFEKDDRQFQVSMDAVGNRLDKLREDAHLRRIFSHVPEQGDDDEYVDNRFDFREFLEENATILFDLGDLRPEAQRAITLLLLSNLWDAVRVRRRDGETDYENLTNLIIEEAAPVASTKLVSEQLLPQGRSFGLSMGLVMQFPGQVRNRSERAYDEVLNNIKTKLIGNISIERDLAESLAHEDLSPTDLRNRINTLPSGEWIAQLPSPSFGETGPAPFSVKPLPIAAGHPESDEPLSVEQEDHFETVAIPRLSERTQSQYGLAEASGESEAADNEGWGSRSNDARSTSAESASSVDSTQSSFIGQATSGSAASEEGEKEADTTNSLFGDPEPTESEEPAAEAEETTIDENGSSPLQSPVQAGGVTVPDDELRRRRLTHDDVRFLTRILDVMNGDSTDHTLLGSMSAFKNDFDDLDVQRLVDQDLLEEGRACGRKYYTVLPAGRELLGQKLKVGPGQGDIGEKTPHKVGVKLLELWLEARDDVEKVEPYYEYDEETVFDVAGLDADGELVWVGEAELASNNKHAPVDDYDKQSRVDANVVWAFNRRETAVEVLDHLAEADRIESSVSGRAARSFSDIREAVESFDAAGLTTIRSFNKLDQEFNS